ncbi:MAG: hypothetical protein VW547_11285 [Alphaproteobacteria bacterium]
MAHKLIPALLAILLVLAPSAVRADDYFAAIDDLPVAPGMTEDENASVVFDSPAGRIITVIATGNAQLADLRTYYRSALPALGWDPQSADAYVREGATLTFTYSGEGDRLTMRIRLATSGAEN